MAKPKDKAAKFRTYRQKKGFKTVDGKKVSIYGKPKRIEPANEGWPHQDPRREGGIEGQERGYLQLPNTTWNPIKRKRVDGQDSGLWNPEPEARQMLEDWQWKNHPRDKKRREIEGINKTLRKTNSGQIDLKRHTRHTRRTGGKPIPRNEPMNPFLAGKGESMLRKYYPEGEERKHRGVPYQSDEPLRRGPRGTKPGTRMSKEAWEKKRKRLQMEMEEEARRKMEDDEFARWKQRWDQQNPEVRGEDPEDRRLHMWLDRRDFEQGGRNLPRNPRKKGVGFG